MKINIENGENIKIDCIKFNKMFDYLDELIKFGVVFHDADAKFGRKHKAPVCGYAISIFSGIHNINIVKDPLSYHFFKVNFFKGVC